MSLTFDITILWSCFSSIITYLEDVYNIYIYHYFALTLLYFLLNAYVEFEDVSMRNNLRHKFNTFLPWEYVWEWDGHRHLIKMKIQTFI